jgi:hypothetical protein
MPVKAPVLKAPPMVYDWTGFYIGGHFGFGWDDQTHTRLIANDNFPAGFVVKDTLRGGLGGFQAGANYQVNQFVIGLEGDFSWADLAETDTVFSPCPAADFGVLAAATAFGNPAHRAGRSSALEHASHSAACGSASLHSRSGRK